jgi:hypothetical protein
MPRFATFTELDVPSVLTVQISPGSPLKYEISPLLSDAFGVGSGVGVAVGGTVVALGFGTAVAFGAGAVVATGAGAASPPPQAIPTDVISKLRIK